MDGPVPSHEIPLPSDEDERLFVLRAYQILDTPSDEAFDRITRLASSILKMPIALVSLVDRDRQWFKSRVGIDAEETPREYAFCAHTIMNDEVMVVPDALADPRFSENPLVTADPKIRFYAGAPLRTRDGFNLGTLCVVDRAPCEIDEEQKNLLRDLASMVVGEMELRLRESTDPLTGALTHRHFMQVGEKEFRTAQKVDHPFSVAVIDVDGFEAINGENSSAIGDAVLIALARLIERHTRAQDVVARIGNDKFTVLLPDTAEAGAREILEQVRESAAGLDIAANGQRVTVALSIGVAACLVDDKKFEDALCRADQAMHAVKNADRSKAILTKADSND